MEYDSPEPTSVQKLRAEASVKGSAMEHPGGSGSSVQGASVDSDAELDLDLTGSVNGEEDAEPSGIMQPVVVSYGTPIFTDGTHKEFTFESARYPGVILHFRRYNFKQGLSRVRYRCISCWETSGKNRLSEKNPRSFGGSVIVQDGQIVQGDPDYPQFATGHLCQGGQLTNWSTQGAGAKTLRSREPKSRKDSNVCHDLNRCVPSKTTTVATPAALGPLGTFGIPNYTDASKKGFLYDSKRYTGVTFRFERYSFNSSSTRVYYRCTACWEESEKKTNARCFGGFAIVQDGQIVESDPDNPPFATGHLCRGGKLTHWPSTPVAVKEPSPLSAEPEKSVVAKDLAKPKREPPIPTTSGNVPSFGAAIRRPGGTAIFYRSTFYPDHVFKFELSAEHANNGKVRRLYVCADCHALGQQQPAPVITEEHRFILRDPDWPAGAPHACMQSGRFSRHQLPS
ncbi:hypothetical protein AAVH_05781 [Aphelenchoides avenae]|nr:hypothetical protein AAVH_05781 [Aphelenchus avenae]